MSADPNPGNDPVILIGAPRTATSDAADLLLDGCTMALQEFDTKTLLAIADYRESLNPGGWMQRMIWGYVDVWR